LCREIFSGINGPDKPGKGIQKAVFLLCGGVLGASFFRFGGWRRFHELIFQVFIGFLYGL